MEPTFPLFRQPENAIVHVLQNMNSDRLFIFSLVSTKTKNLVTSLGLRAVSVYIGISFEICLNVNFDTSGWNLIFSNGSNDQNAEFDVTRPISASTFSLHQPFQPSTSFNFSDWLNHILTIFCCTNLLAVAFKPGSEQFEMESLKNTLNNVNSLAITEGVTDIHSKQILNSFKDLKKLALESNPFEDNCEVQTFFIQNFEKIEFRDVYSLDDMLLVNSEEVRFTKPISQKQFNQFLKHWIRGSNPRLQDMFLSIDNTTSVSREVLLKGIDCVDVAEVKQLAICEEQGIVSDYMVEIRRNDETTAVIATKDFENILYIRFFAYY
ncbi:hypothetical protein GCK72_008544 [Caenorhabditis remanei]|uniref:F-box domain-containing protein n=1 Tax=Caenorhabditis remanei TaxID=31234 RepID=A0A6A5GYZ1_CAERE|nr:hypothetical protein GCK72_008544 [Caenorhabditis remanei]KAF1760297.1 hypothetical protein GCK72_008544 [Caenorhabditis remanei]